MNLSDSIFPAVSSQMRALLSLLELEYFVAREPLSCKNLSDLCVSHRLDTFCFVFQVRPQTLEKNYCYRRVETSMGPRIVVLIFGVILIKIKY